MEKVLEGPAPSAHQQTVATARRERRLAVAALEQAHPPDSLWRPMTVPGAPPPFAPLEIVSASGMFVRDRAGTFHLDMTAGLACVNVGHGRQEMLEAITQQMNRLAVWPVFADVCHPAAQQLAQRLTGLLEPEGMQQVLFSNSGSDAVETAIKLARQYWLLAGLPGKKRIYSLRNAYHGVHYGAASASGMAVLKQAYAPMAPGFAQVESPASLGMEFAGQPEQCCSFALRQLEREILSDGPDAVAAVLVEPIQGAAGIIIPPGSFLPQLRRLCDFHNILLIADEVFTGFGRTGQLMACRLWDVRPDILCMAKALTSGYVPMGATAVNARVSQAWQSAAPTSAIADGHTSSGHPLACAAAMASLDLIENEGLVAHSQSLGAAFLQRLQTLVQLPQVASVRGQGLMLAVELVRDKRTAQPFAMDSQAMRHIRAATLHSRVLVRLAPGLITLTPPLIISQRQMEHCVQVLGQVLTQLRLD